MKKKLLLIHPVNPTFKGLGLKSEGRVPPLALAILAGLTPKDWEVRIMDENYTPVEFQEVDLVGITVLTPTAPRAYEIASIFRDKGVATVIGGIHPSFLPEEALQHADVIVKGEAESVWQKLLADFEAGALQKVYERDYRELKNTAVPRHDLLHHHYIGAVQTSRGCPMNCAYCSVTAFNGKRYRHRPIAEVLDELENIQKRFVFFVDDNIIGHGRENEERALVLFKGMIERGIKKRWAGQASMNFADNEEVLRYAAKSGCCQIMLGIEAEIPSVLQEMDKNLNLRKLQDSYAPIFKRIHKYGIAIHGFFMYGMDSDTEETMRQRTKFIKKCAVDSVGVSIVCPFPGTRLYERIKDEGRLRYSNYPQDWQRYHFHEIAQVPKSLSIDTLERVMHDAYEQLYRWRAIVKRFCQTVYRTRSIFAAIVSLIYQIRMRRIRYGMLKENIWSDRGKFDQTVSVPGTK